METFADVIAAFPDDSLPTGLGVSKTLVAVWKHRKRIPSEYWQGIAALKVNGEQVVSAEDLAAIDATRAGRAA